MSNIVIDPSSGILEFNTGSANGSSFDNSLLGASRLEFQNSGQVALTSLSTGVSEKFTVDGPNGRLFTVDNEVTGSIFSINDAAGLPIVEVFSDDRVVMGEFASDALVISGSSVQVTGSNVVTEGYLSNQNYLTSSTETYSTASELLTAIKTVDGANSNLDADKLDAQEGSYYLNYNNFTNTPTIPSAYSLPLSSSSTRGGVKIGFGENGKNYPVELDSSEKMFVNVPWVDTNTDTNTTYSAGTHLALNGTTFNLNLGVADKVVNIGHNSTNNEGEIILDTSNAGSPQISFTEHGDASWAIGVDDDDNSFKIHGSASSTIPTINGKTTPLFEITTSGVGYLNGSRVFADNYHPNADTLTTARTISLGGDLSGSASFNGSSDITITAVVGNDSHTHDGRYYTETETTNFLNLKANLASPALTGNPTAPTQAVNNNSTRIATTAYVQTEISDLIGGAPGALDTLNELAAAINDDATFSNTVTTSLGNRLRVDTASQGLNSTQKSNARTNLGLGSAATSASSAFATSSQGTSAENALPKSGGTMTGDITLSSGKHINFASDSRLKYSTTHWIAPRDQYGNMHLHTASGGIYLDSTAIYIREYGSTANKVTIDQGNLTATGTVAATGGNSTNWNTAYADRNKWDGGSTGLTASTGRTSLGLGSAATQNTSAFATAAQGTSAENAMPDDFLNTAKITFTVGGDADTYYPVSIQGAGQYAFQMYSISRQYNATAPNTWNTSTHKGGLTLTWQYSGDSFWGGNDHDIRIVKFDETYSNMVMGIAGSVGGGGTHAGVVVWLRGGTASYTFHGPRGSDGDVNVHLTSVTANNGTVFSSRSYNASTRDGEILPKYPIRDSSLLYDNNNRVARLASPAFTGTPTAPTTSSAENSTKIATTAYVKSQGYITSANGSNAATLDGIDSTSFLRSDANDSFSGNLTNNGSNHITFGPNSTWAKNLRIGGNGHQGNSTTANIATTNGNLHLDAAVGSYGTYLNYYAGTTGVAFGNGASAAVAWMGPDGDLWKGSGDNSGSKYWHAGNDGSGSGLDADKLDGNHASAFATAAQGTSAETAYGWGDHSGAGYLTSSSTQSKYLRSDAADTASGVISFTGGHGAINITNSSILSSASSNWTGNPGGAGKIQYHSNRWYMVSDSSSNRIVQFRRNSDDVSYIANNGDFVGNVTGALTGNASTATSAIKLAGFSNQTEYDLIRAGNLNGLYMKARWDGSTSNRYWDMGYVDGYGTFYSGLKVINNGDITYKGNEMWHAGNDGSGSNLDADTTDGLHVHNTQSTQNSANAILRTQANGYTKLGWIETTSGNNNTTAISRIYASHDSYIRYYTPANFGAQIGSHISYNDLTNKPTIPSAYSLPAASSSTRGGVKIGYSENGKNYPVEVSSEKMFVNVPWTDTNTDTNTTYSAGTGLTLSGTTFSITDTISSSASNNTIVKRHSSGYIFANYFNTTPNTVSSGVTQICVETGNDGYIRHGTAAAVRSFINVASGANNYSLPAGSSSTRGGFKIGYAESGKYYPVEVSSEKMFVHVPWTDTNTDTNTTYSAGTGISLSGTTFSLTDTASKLSLSGGTMTGTINSRDIKFANGYHLMRSNHSSGHLEGSYNNVGENSTKSNPIYTIGSSYNPTDAALSNMYGVGYTHTNASFISMTGASGWGMYVAADGDARVFLGGSNGAISSTGEHYANGSSRVFHDTYHPNADTLTTTRNIALAGDVTGSVNFNGSSNVSISTSLAANSVGSSEIANNAVGAAEIANDAVGADQISANAVGASELNVSGNGSTSQFLRSDGDGTFTWATPTDTNTNTTYSAGRGLDLSGTQFLLETDLRDSISYIGYDSNDYLQWSNNSYLRSVVSGTERFRVNTSGIDVTGTATANAFRTDTGNTDYNVISRNSTSTTLWVQAAQSGSLQGIASFRYGSATVNQGTEVCAIRRNSSYFINTKLGVGTSSPSTSLDVSGTIHSTVYNATSLPSASPAGQRAFAYSYYPLATSHGSVVSTNGSYVIPVYSDGSSWRAG